MKLQNKPIIETAVKKMIEHFKRDQDGLLIPNPNPKQTLSSWIHVTKANQTELENLAALYEFPVDYLTSAFDEDEVSRYEKLGLQQNDSPSLLVLLYPKKKINDLDLTVYTTRPLSIILTKNTLITASNENSELLNQFIKDRTDKTIYFESHQQFVLSIAMLIASLFISYLKEINKATDALEAKLKHTSKSQHLFELMELQKSLVYLDSALNTNHPVIERLKDLENFTQSEEDSELLRDVMVENHQAEVMSSQSYKLLQQLSNTFSSVISNNLNLIVKFLTSITLIFTIPTLIGSLWGMNVPVPFEQSPYGFAILVFTTLVLAGVTAYWMKKNGYF